MSDRRTLYTQLPDGGDISDLSTDQRRRTLHNGKLRGVQEDIVSAKILGSFVDLLFFWGLLAIVRRVLTSESLNLTYISLEKAPGAMKDTKTGQWRTYGCGVCLDFYSALLDSVSDHR